MKAIGKALFLDLDGTVIVTRSGSTFPKSKDDWQFKEGIMDKIDTYVERGCYIMIVSNQGGIEAGHVLLNDFRQKIRQVTNEIIVQTGCPFSRLGYRFSMSNNPDDYYRKPNPGMGYDLAMAYILDLSQCLMVGDASGKVKRTEQVYEDKTSSSGWSYRNGQNVSQAHAADIIMSRGIIEFRDHADSDLKFAKACGMTYLDVDDFLRQMEIPFNNVQC